MTKVQLALRPGFQSMYEACYPIFFSGVPNLAFQTLELIDIIDYERVW